MLLFLLTGLAGQPATLPNIDDTIRRCPSEVTRALDPATDRLRRIEAPNLLQRSVEPLEVRRYLLLDRRDENNCPLPISFPVSGPTALGRELGPQAETPRFAPPRRPAVPQGE